MDTKLQVITLRQNILGYDTYLTKLYQVPWTRISPYIIGIMSGILIQRLKSGQVPKLLTRWVFVLSLSLLRHQGREARSSTLSLSLSLTRRVP